MNLSQIIAPMVAGTIVLAGCAGPQIGRNGPDVRDTSVGKVFADSDGMTLYTYDRDRAGRSTCTGACAVIWPPAEASGNLEPTDGFTLIRRDDEQQWAYHGHPLYGYVRDSKPGDVSGDGVDGVWHVARP